VLLALAILVSACGSAAIWPGAKQGAAPKVAPAFSGVTLDGKAVTLDQFRGKPLLLVYMSPT
jgi:cytochrome oxidase Cu insertion factor (SCO1/SenC/PrrC family)